MTITKGRKKVFPPIYLKEKLYSGEEAPKLKKLENEDKLYEIKEKMAKKPAKDRLKTKTKTLAKAREKKG